MPGDLILIPNSPKYYFRDNLYIILGITTTLVSIATLMVTMFYYNSDIFIYESHPKQIIEKFLNSKRFPVLRSFCRQK